MVFVSCVTLLLLSTAISADYDIDNADTSIIYSMPPTGYSWQTCSMANLYDILLSNSTGNYTIIMDPSNCYDQNYASAEGGCGTGDNCFVQVPFTGSGITMYVFNAGLSGMTASFSVDSEAAIPGSIAAPTAAENYQVSNVSLYDIQGLPSGNHSIKMTLMDWEGGVTFMKFDYAHVNETFVAVPSPITTSAVQTPTQTPTRPTSASNGIGVGGIVGIALGAAAILGGIIISILWFRKRRTSHRGSSSSIPKPTFQIEPFTLEQFGSTSRPYTQHSPSLSLHSDENPVVSPQMRSAILRDALVVANSSAPIQRPQSVSSSRTTSSALRPLRRQPSYNAVPTANEEPWAFSDSEIASQHNLTPTQIETVRGLLANRVPADAIVRVIEAFMLSQPSGSEANARQVIPSGSSEYAFSLGLPPSYQTRAR